MSPENTEKYNAMIKRINNMSRKEFDQLIKEDKCPFEPEHLIGLPLGMFHCDCCGEMVVAGVPHPRYSQIP